MRPEKDIESDKDIIIQRFQNGENATDIGATYQVSRRTIQRRLQGWDVRKRVVPATTFDDIQRLRAIIATLFFDNMRDSEIDWALLCEGWPEERRGVRIIGKLRRSMGLRRRLSLQERLVADEHLFEVLKRELDQGFIEGYGRGLLWSEFRRKRELRDYPINR
jgi:hypothetical protein